MYSNNTTWTSKQYKKIYQECSQCPLVVVGVSWVQFEEGCHEDKGSADAHLSYVLQQFLVQAENLTNVAEDGDNHMVRDQAILTKRSFEILKLYTNMVQ